MTALQPGGGIRTFFRYVFGQSCFSDCQFTLVAPDAGLSDYLDEFLPAGRFKLIEAEQGYSQFVRQIRGLSRSGDFDLIHSHGFSAGLLTEIARTGLRTPHLMTAHDVFLSAQFSGVKGYVKKAAMSLLFSRMTAIHNVTEDAKNNLQSFFPRVKEERLRCILHGVDTEYFRDGGSRNLRSEFGLDESIPLIGFFGRFMNQKGFRLLVDTIEQIRNKQLVEPMPHVITFGWGAFIREDYQYLNDKGLGPYFHQAEQTNDMAAALKGVDLVAMPSRWEACGLLAMEALAAGVPIVGSDCIGLREVLEGTPARISRNGDSESLLDQIVADLNELPQRKEAFLEYQAEAVERFSIHRPATKLRSLYNDIV